MPEGPITDVVRLVNDILSGEFATIEYPNGTRVVLPIPKGVSDEVVQKVEGWGQEIETAAYEYDYWLDPSRVPVRGPAEVDEPDLECEACRHGGKDESHVCEAS